MEIKVLTCSKGFVKVGIPDDFYFLRVTLMSGDEIIEVYRCDLTWGGSYLYKTIDLEAENRTRNFFDATYIVRPDQMEIWNTRREAYHIWQKDEFKEVFDGYFGSY